MKQLTILLVLLCVLYGGSARANSLCSNPYGAYVSGDAWNYELNANTVPAQQQQYTNGDPSCSGTITLHASGNATIDGGYAASAADVPGNQLFLTANADTDSPIGGNVYSVATSASGAIWDTLQFSGGTSGEIGSFILNGSGSSDSSGAYGDGVIYACPVLGSGCEQGSFAITAGTGSSVTTFINFPLDTGPVQFVEGVALNASASWSSGELASDITFDPAWTFILPPGVSFTSSSGAEYSTTSNAPEPATALLLTLGLVGLAGIRRKLG